jgi:hypothetical protein
VKNIHVSYQSWWSCTSSKLILCLGTTSSKQLPKVKIVSPSSTIDFFLHFGADKAVSFRSLFCALAQFHFLKHFSKVNIVSPSCAIDAIWCMMLCYANDVMMLCYAKWYLCRRYTHIPIVEYTISLLFIFRLHRLFFGVSALTFRCKFCIPLGTSFELLRLLFQRYSRWLFAFRLIFWQNQRLFFVVSSAFPLERLLSRKLMLCSLMNDFL